MVDYLSTIEKGLIIENPKIVLPWNLQKKELFDKFKDINTVNENYYSIKIVLAGINFVNCAGLHFEKEKLTQIDLFDDTNSCTETAVGKIFDSNQSVLENLLGKPTRNKLLEKLKEVYKQYKWQFGHITIIHKLWDRFGIEEVLKIYINS